MTEIRVRRTPTTNLSPVDEANPLPVTVEEPIPPAVSWELSARTTGALALSVPIGRTSKLRQVSCLFSAAPTTSENFTVTLDSHLGSVFDVVLFSTDPSVTSATSIVYQPDGGIPVFQGDEIDIAFTNTDAGTIGCQAVVEDA